MTARRDRMTSSREMVRPRSGRRRPWPCSPPGPTGEPAGSRLVFDFVAHQFYEIPMLARIRRPSQLFLLRCHLAVAAVASGPWPGLDASPGPITAGPGSWIFWIGYVIRATVWICGGNLPLVPGDSCHYIEVATSVFRGEGPVKHYVESFFTDYPRIRQGQGVLDDWATPLDAYLLAGAFRLAGIEPLQSLESTVGVAKACSFVLNLLCLPALYVFARRRFGRRRGARGDGRAGGPAGARDLRRVRAPREPGRPDLDPGRLDRSPRSGTREGNGRAWVWAGLAGLCARGWRSWRGTRRWRSWPRPVCMRSTGWAAATWARCSSGSPPRSW